MKAVDAEGREVETRAAEGPEPGVLANLDVETLRRFLISVMTEGGVPTRVQAEVMRSSVRTTWRDRRPPKPAP